MVLILTPRACSPVRSPSNSPDGEVRASASWTNLAEDGHCVPEQKAFSLEGFSSEMARWVPHHSERGFFGRIIFFFAELYLEALHKTFFVMGIFEIGSRTICPGRL
jgi:hypothetical protein